MHQSDRTINREILSLSLPSILANITVPIVGMVDIAVAGHMSAGQAATLIGGISIGTMLFDLLYWNFGFLRIGTGGLTAQAYGRGDRKEISSILYRGLALSLLIAAGMILLQWPFTLLAFLVVDCSEEVKELALKYFFIRIWAAPATLSLFVLKGWFIGMQDTVSSMFTDLLVNVVNIALSIILALGVGSWKGMGFPGVATGTVVAQYSGLVFALCVVAFKYGRKIFPDFSPGKVGESLHGGEIKRFMTINGDLFIRSICLVIVYVSFTTISARYGDLMLSTASILMKLLLLFSYFTDGFAYAGEALTGKYIGMQDKPMTRKTVKWTFIWSMSIGLFFILVYIFGGTPILHILTNDGEVVDACRQFFVWLLPMPLIGCVAFTWDGIFVGATASKALRDSTIWCVVAFFAAWFVGINVARGLSGEILGERWNVLAIHILLGAYFAHLFARSLYMTLLYKRSVLVAPFEGRKKE